MSGQERKKKAEDFMAAMVAKCAKMVDEAPHNEQAQDMLDNVTWIAQIVKHSSVQQWEVHRQKHGGKVI